jgi:hypothetical protein
MNQILFFILTKLLILNIAHASNSPFDPGPDGVRFSRKEITRIEKSLDNKIDKSTLLNLSDDETIELQNLKTILSAGKRAISWFEQVNNSRTSGNKMDLSAKGNSRGLPLTDPMKTNSLILFNTYNLFLSNYSPLITNIITSSDPFPLNIPVSDNEFSKTIRAMDVIYQHTIRWIGSKDSLSWYINRSLWDIRGYVFLKETTDLKNKLDQWKSLSDLEKNNFSQWLMSLCHNGDFEESDCYDELSKAIIRNRLYSFYQRFNFYGEAQYNSFFKIMSTRPEMTWNENLTELHSPFLTPLRNDVKLWLSENIQDEWKGVGFNLKLDFLDSSDVSIPHIEFKPGVTAHVNDLAGDTITMDGDYSINNYDQRWTIRHEYGHILGFIDCYLEFYDVNEKAMIYYEVDTDNLMCSRHGSLKPKHIEMLRENYKNIN